MDVEEVVGRERRGKGMECGAVMWWGSTRRAERRWMMGVMKWSRPMVVRGMGGGAGGRRREGVGVGWVEVGGVGGG
ncbi:hypothetical protein, partial [Dermacoccus nishinomiyaensis]|uniref:hypothetical protein n=1 Tax=Dermacoccus nishinomiyaensis TaxID=1274 RepID=UPI001642CDD5